MKNLGTASKTATVKVTKVQVTTKENAVLQALIGELYAEAGFSDVDCKDLAKATKMPLASVKGVLGSLTVKGLVTSWKNSTEDVDLICITPLVYNLHPEWKEEAEHNVQLVITDTPEPATAGNSKVKSLKEEEAKKSSKTVKGSIKETATASEVVAPAKPYSVFGLHGKNVEIEGYKKGDSVSFKIKTDEVVGEFIHFHVNNWSKKGYAVIKFNGKIYERVLDSINKVKRIKAVKPADTKKVGAKA